MRRVVVRYRTHADRADENAALIRAVFAELAQTAPAGLAYASYRLDDGVSFLHVAELDTGDGTNPLAASPAFQAFTRDIRERCEAPPESTTVDLVGRYP